VLKTIERLLPTQRKSQDVPIQKITLPAETKEGYLVLVSSRHEQKTHGFKSTETSGKLQVGVHLQQP
jgi:hypothetical protein